MFEQAQNTDPLLRQFHMFYMEIERLREVAEGRPAEVRAEAVPVLLPVASAVSQPDLSANDAVRALVKAQPGDDKAVSLAGEPIDPVTLRVWQDMAQYLDQKLYEARTMANQLSRDLMEELVYIFAAFSDETFLCLVQWPGRDYWRNHLMEMRLFGSRISGQVIFSRIDNLLSRQDFGADEICAIYLTILALGFRGRFLREPEIVDNYRQRLFDRLLLNHPDLYNESQRLLPEAYRHTVVEGAPVRLPEPKTWWLIVASIVGIWLILSTAAWLVLTTPVRADLKRTSQSLSRLMARQSNVTASTSWQAWPLTLQDNAYRVDLRDPLTPRSVGTGENAGSPVVSLLLAVTGEGDAGKAAVLQEWLRRGAVAFAQGSGEPSLKSRPIQSVQPWRAPANGPTVSSGAQFFLIAAPLDLAELNQHPQLVFPVDEKTPRQINAVTLYIPRQVATDAP
jgi:type VI secretion system protein ImpK